MREPRKGPDVLYYKLTDAHDRTHGGCQWGDGVTHTAPGGGQDKKQEGGVAATPCEADNAGHECPYGHLAEKPCPPI